MDNLKHLMSIQNASKIKDELFKKVVGRILFNLDIDIYEYMTSHEKEMYLSCEEITKEVE